MAIVYRNKHHRNPSGCNNKAKWILSETKWNKAKAIRLVERVTAEMPKGKQRSSWYVALGIALAMFEEARTYDLNVARSIDNYINIHGNTIPHYILDYATGLCDYIREEVRRGKL